MHAARICAAYSAMTGSLSHIRTVALKPLVLDVAPSAEHLAVANALLNSKATLSYEPDALHYPRLNQDKPLLTHLVAPQVPLTGVELESADWAMCKKVGYHSDDVDSDTTAYAFWCVKSTAPMTLMLGGNGYPMKDGTLVIFDARVPHALLSGDPNALMSAMIATVPLTPELQEHLGVSWRRAGAIGLDKLAIMDRLDIDNDTGYFSSGP